ncbi:MAG: type II toxin-antitoxin system RelE/ParE family toxin [Deltaproteobacteria bacterium]|nr:MAG: type II toxin-antitoxin system RelE/ParE family toxin [Deltaproteobacteria bacterium]
MTGKTKPVWRVEINHQFDKKLSKLPRPDRQQILSALEKLEQAPLTLAKSLKGRPDWRLRVGNWRILLRVNRKIKVIIAYDLGPRGDIYK